MTERVLLKVLFIVALILTNMAFSCGSENGGQEHRSTEVMRANKAPETQEMLIRNAKELLESSQQYLTEATTTDEKRAWRESIAAWDKALDMAHKAREGRSDSNWDPDIWESAHDAWEKAAAFRRPSREECERQRDELRRNQPPPEDGAVGGDMYCGEEIPRIRQGG